MLIKEKNLYQSIYDDNYENLLEIFAVYNKMVPENLDSALNSYCK